MEELIMKIYNDFIRILSPFIGSNTTYSDDINKKAIHILGNRFRGVYASDELPSIKNNQMYISNLDTRSEPGSHWVAVYKKNNKLYVYDSFGRQSKTIFNNIYKKGGSVIDFDLDAEQNIKQTDCGLRAIVALYMMDEFGPEIISKYL